MRLGSPLSNHLVDLIKLVLARGLARTGGKEPVSELLVVADQQLLYLQWICLVQGIEKGLRTGRRLVFLDRYVHPACGAING